MVFRDPKDMLERRVNCKTGTAENALERKTVACVCFLLLFGFFYFGDGLFGIEGAERAK